MIEISAEKNGYGSEDVEIRVDSETVEAKPEPAVLVLQ